MLYVFMDVYIRVSYNFKALTGPDRPFQTLPALPSLPGPYWPLPALSDPSRSFPALSRPYDAHRRRAFKVVSVCYRFP